MVATDVVRWGAVRAMRQRLTRHALTHRPRGRGAQASLPTYAKLANVPPCVRHPSRNPAPAARVRCQGRQACQLVGIGHRRCRCGYRGQAFIETGDPSVRCATGSHACRQACAACNRSIVDTAGHKKHRRGRRTPGPGAAFNSTIKPSIDAVPHDRWGHQDTGNAEHRRGTARSAAPPTHGLVTLRTNVEHARLRRRRRTPGLPAAMDGTTKTPITEVLRNR